MPPPDELEHRCLGLLGSVEPEAVYEQLEA
jgi:hypothetical protein